MACWAGLALGVPRRASAEAGLLVPRKPTVAEGKLAVSFSEFTEAPAQGEAPRDFVKPAPPQVAEPAPPQVAEPAPPQVAEPAPQVSRLTVIVPEEVARLGPEVKLDGRPLPAWGVEEAVDPGVHLLEARAEGCGWWSVQLKLNAGEQHVETVSPLSCHYPLSARPPTAALVPHEEKAGWKKRREAAGGLAIVGSFAVLVALALEVGNDPVHDANPECGVIAHSGRPHCLGIAHRHEKAAVTFGIGMASLTASVVLWVTATRPSQSVALRVGIAPGALHARVTW